MLTTGAILHGDRERFLRFAPQEHPVIIQLGGDDPQKLAECARICEDYGYDGINLNCGCPSDRVQSGNFGACLMSQPDLVARCVDEMQKAVRIPVSVKCRLATDEYEEKSFLIKFIEQISKVNCAEITIHARKAWLKGLSPKENRDIPPLNYPLVYEMKQRYPHLRIGINGGIKTPAETRTHLSHVDHVMIGREAYQNPHSLAAIERKIYSTQTLPSRETIARSMIPYIEQQQRDYGTPPKSVTRHMIGLFHQQPGGRQWRRHLSENAHKDDISARDLIENALEARTRAANTRHAA